MGKGKPHAGDGLIFQAPQKHIIRNEKTLYQYKKYWDDVMLSLYRYNGLSDTIDEEKLEEYYYYNGECYYFHDDAFNADRSDSFGDFILPGKKYSTDTDINGKPLQVQCQGQGTKGNYRPVLTNTYRRKEFVHLKNSPTARPMSSVVFSLCERLATIKRAIDVNIEGQRTPIAVVVDEDTRFTNINIMQQINEGKQVIVISRSAAELHDIKPLDIRVEFIADRLYQIFNTEVNEFLSQIGVENSNVDKRERVNVQETNGGSGLQERGRNIFLNQRRKDFNAVNKIFGRNIEVGFDSDLITMLNAPDIVSGLTNKQVEYTVNRSSDNNVSRETIREEN